MLEFIINMEGVIVFGSLMLKSDYFLYNCSHSHNMLSYQFGTDSRKFYSSRYKSFCVKC